MPKKSIKEKNKQVSTPSINNYLGKIESEIKANPSRLSMILGGLIVLVIGILIFNYSNKNQPSLGPAQQAEQNTQEDVTPESLPGKYTIKEGDTLFLIAETYYKNGGQFELIAKANNLTDVNMIEVGQVIEIPRAPVTEALASPTTTPLESAEPVSTSTPEVAVTTSDESNLGKGGSDNTIWGEKINGTTYTVQEGDWLSTISARAYGDIQSFNKIAEANNIQNADYIVPGQVLKIPR